MSSEEKAQVPPFTDEKVQAILEASEEHRYHSLWVLLFDTGVRPHEALALRWEDVDFDTRRVTIHRTLDGEGEIQNKGKSKAGLRTITLPQRSMGVLREHRKAHINETWARGHEWNSKGYLFATKLGSYPSRTTVLKSWKRTLKRAGVEYKRLYQTRHTHARTGTRWPIRWISFGRERKLRREPMRYLLVLMVVVLVGCDDPVEPSDDPPLATVDRLNTTLIDFNDAGQALWEIREVGFFLWDGSEVHELPFRARDLGPDGAVSWGGLYWKNGELTDIEEFGASVGIDGQGRVYGWSGDGPSWWTPNDGIVGEAPRAGQRVSWVGEDGSVVSRVYEGHDVFTCYRHTLSGYERITLCNVISMTENGLLALSNRRTLVVDVHADPWTSQEFEFEAWDMNDHVVFTATDGTVRDSTGNVLMELDATQALINDNNEVLVMSPEGEIRIIEIE